MKPVTPKQAAYLGFLGYSIPDTSAEASRLIQTAHESSDDEIWRKTQLWRSERAWLHPDLYPGELEIMRAGRVKAIYDFNNSERGIGCPLKRLTKAQITQIVDWLDHHQRDWDRGFWNDLFGASVSTFYDVIVPAVWQIDPSFFKKGYAPSQYLASSTPENENIRENSSTRCSRAPAQMAHPPRTYNFSPPPPVTRSQIGAENMIREKRQSFIILTWLAILLTIIGLVLAWASFI